MGNINKRTGEIIEILKENSGASIRELASKLNVTEMTIRRDVKTLKEAGIVRNISGAIVLAVDDEKFYSQYITKEQESEYAAEKLKIARFAAQFIKDQDVVYIDVGTTTVKIIETMENCPNATVVCSTLNSLSALQRKNHNKFFLTGGWLQEGSEMLVSNKGVEALKEFGITKAFISAAGVNARLGVTCVNAYEVNYKKMAIERAVEKYLVVDSSKFGAVRMNSFATLDKFDAVITDKNLSDEWIAQIEELGVKLYLC